MSAKDLNIDLQNRIIKIRQLAEDGKITIPDYRAQIRGLGLNPDDIIMSPFVGMSDLDVKTGNIIGRFRLFFRKIKHTLTDEPHYYFMLTWGEAQSIIDCFDDTPTLHADMLGISAKLSEQLKWQAEGPK